MTIVYASDKNYAALTAISAVSALRYNRGARIVLLGYNLETDAQELVRNCVEKAGGVFFYRDISPSVDKLVRQGVCPYTSYAAYARIFIPDVLDDEERVLYLDCDTLVDGSLEELFATDLQSKPFAIGYDCVLHCYKRYIHQPFELPYYNSGVMLIDVNTWRSHRCTERILAELEHPSGPNPLGDQDVIVRVFPQETRPIDPKWNFLSQFFMLSYKGLRRIVGEGEGLLFSAGAYDEARQHPMIYHFSGQTLGRPWFTSSMHPMRRLYQSVARSANLVEAAEQVRPMPFAYRVQYRFYRHLPQGLFDRICYFLYRLHICLTYRV